MRNRMPQICGLILTLLLVMIVTGCGEVFRTDVNESPDDDISKAIYEAIGKKKVHYYGKKFSKSDENAVYKYIVYDYEDENLLTDMVEAANTVIKEKKMTEKIDLAILGKMAGGTEGLVSLCNYYEDEDGYQQYEALQCLRISGSKHSNKGSLYNKASIYINLSDIKSLVVSEAIAQNAEEEGIDWYEIWPDLEYYEVWGDFGELLRTEVNKSPDDDISKAVYEAVGGKKVQYYGKKYGNSDDVTGYCYTVCDYEDENLLTDIVEVANTAIKEKDTSQKIYLEIWEKIPGGSETVVRLHNYYEDENEYEQYEVLQCLYILGTEYSNKGDTSPYNRASIYTNLPEIKRLFVTDKIAQNAEAEAIDWYEIWPDLEYYEVLEK